ncbi:Cyanovirin-N [Xylariaceae sp. FL1651]|nr:Cyanovirin-N [Xylariaceae sp. FL1651]
MSFEATSRNISLQHDCILWADCRKRNNQWRRTSIELSRYIGNSDGAFTFSKPLFSKNAENIKLHGAILSAKLRRRDGTLVSATLNLNICIANMNGYLEFQKPKESLLSSGCCFKLVGPILRGLCLGLDGTFHASEINLNDYYGNDNGNFVTDRHFHYSSRDVAIEVSNDSVLLKAELKGYHWYSGYFWKTGAIDLANNICVRDGRFVFEKHDGFFHRDGLLVKLFEPVPFVGFPVAGLHAIAGNQV